MTELHDGDVSSVGKRDLIAVAAVKRLQTRYNRTLPDYSWRRGRNRCGVMSVQLARVGRLLQKAAHRSGGAIAMKTVFRPRLL